MIRGKCSIHVGCYYFNNLFSLPMGELQCILRCKWQTFWQVGFVERRKNREAKEEKGCQGGHKHCRKGIPSCGSRDPLPASQTAGSRATEDTGQYLIHTEGRKIHIEILYDSFVLWTSVSSPNQFIVSSFLSLAFGVGLPFIMGDAEIIWDIPSPVAFLQKLGQENITCSGWKTSHGVQEGRRAGMPGYSGNH